LVVVWVQIIRIRYLATEVSLKVSSSIPPTMK
jgi:hypothetical protein